MSSNATPADHEKRKPAKELASTSKSRLSVRSGKEMAKMSWNCLILRWSESEGLDVVMRLEYSYAESAVVDVVDVATGW